MKKNIIEILLKNTNLEKKQVQNLIEIPPSPELGDYAFPCFVLSKQLKKSPVQIAEELAKKISEAGIPEQVSEVQSKGPYLNFFVNKKILAQRIIKKILNEKQDYGKQDNNKKTGIEFLAPNTNKPLHLGHLRNMSIGESLSRILEFSGNKVIRLNLFNDRGVHINKSMLAYQKYGKNKKPDKKTDHFVGDYYVLFNKKSKENPEIEKQVQEMLQKWENGDKQILELWKKMDSWAVSGIRETYKKFGIKFDKEYRESEIYKKAKKIVEQGLKKGIFEKREDNAIIINLGKELGEKVLLRSDGTSVYITQDLYLAKQRYQEFKFNKFMYVVGNEQDYHFRVLFKILKLLEFPFSDNLNHVSYGMVFLPQGKMKSREGSVVDADNLIQQMQDLAKKELEKRAKLEKKELEERSVKIALAAIKYFLLKVEFKKNMNFNPQEAISFEGNTGPYLQYSYARASSILRKSDKKPKTDFNYSPEFNETELIKELSQFPVIAEQAYKQFNPAIIANYSYLISQKFNEFYHSTKVIGSEEEESRLALVQSFKIVLEQSLNLLGIQVMEEM
jgi:arginyl-tRNA synthetase